MSVINNHNKNEKVSAAEMIEKDNWVNIDLEPRNLDKDPTRAKANVPAFTDLLDLEARAPPKQRFCRHGTKSKVLVSIALIAMLSAAIFVPVAVVIIDKENRGRR